MSRLVFVPPLPISAFPYRSFKLDINRVDPETLRSYVNAMRVLNTEIACYIRHESTVRILSEYLGLDLKPSSELYSYHEGDTLIVIGLKNPQRGKEVNVSSISDLDIAIVYVTR